jgi:hypothetical protein
MNEENLTREDVQVLLDEARRYLAAVDTFRAEGCRPSWRPECDEPAAAVEGLPGIAAGARLTRPSPRPT